MREGLKKLIFTLQTEAIQNQIKDSIHSFTDFYPNLMRKGEFSQSNQKYKDTISHFKSKVKKKQFSHLDFEVLSN